MSMTTRNDRRIHARARQNGAILVTSMLLLLVLTVLGITMMKMTNMQERMASNVRDSNMALQGAEAALRFAEDSISPFIHAAPPAAATSGVGCDICQPGTLPLDIAERGVFDWENDAHEYGVTGTHELTNLHKDPEYTIEEIAFIEDSLINGQEYYEDGRFFYQVTAHSSGASGLANVVLQSTFARPR
jgi:type IV pilus assembly protein PilX